MFIYYFSNLYTPKRSKRRWSEAFNIIVANAIGISFFGALLYLLEEQHISRGLLGLFAALNSTMSIAARILIMHVLRAARRKGYNLKHVLLIGYGHAAEAYIDRILANPQWGYYIHGILDDNMERGTVYKNIKVLGAIDNLLEILPQNRLDEIAITLSIKEYSKLEKIVGLCEKSGVHTKFIPDYQNFFPTKPYTEDLNGLPVINIRNVPLSNTFNRILKH
jgi:FlaA1/EpsC-like NDP-sugar epimerase